MTAPPSEKPNIFPALRYKEGSVAIKWFKAMGFEELMLIQDPAGRLVHGEMKFGPGVVHIGEIGVEKGHEAIDEARFGISVYVEDVDGHYQRAKAAGAVIEQEPYDTDYGARMYSVRDPEGTLWVFGNYQPQT